MSYRPLIIVLMLLYSVFAKAQDTLTVMQYNLLYYGNYNSGFAGCNEATNNTQEKDECIRTVLGYVKPDILTVCELGARDYLQTDFLHHNLNTNGVTYWETDRIQYSSGSNICNTIFFDSRKMGLKRHTTVDTSPRLTDVFELYLKTQGLIHGDTIKLVCIVAHPKAGTDCEADRRVLIQKTMDYINQHYPTDNVLIMGDFNMYGASESGYRLMTQTYSNPDICFVDPVAYLGGVGAWNNNSQFTQFHTQSTHSTSNDCFVSGGLDDRFDMILMADEIAMNFNHLRYVQGSYKAVGNDGNHFNMSINQNYNAAVPAQVADALFHASDHLPVTMKISVDAHLSISESNMPDLYASIAPNPATNVATVFFNNPKAGQMHFLIHTLQGQVVLSKETYCNEGEQQLELQLGDLAKGFYLLRIENHHGALETLKLMKQ